MAVPTSRHVWVSGKVRVTVDGKANGGTVNAGYYVGCQVNFGAGANVGGGLNVTPPSIDSLVAGTGVTTVGPVTTSEGATLTLGPGKTGFVPVINYTTTNDYGIDVTSTTFDFSGNKAGIAYSQQDFNVEQCAGFAQARAYIQVKVSTDSVDGYVTLVGRPFSLG